MSAIRKYTVILGILMALIAPAAEVMAQGRPKLPISTLRQIDQYRKVPGLMAAREFQEAISIIDKTLPLLRQHLDTYPQFAAAIEDGTFNKAICILEMGNYDGAISAFQSYLNVYSKGRHRKPAIILWSDAHAAKEEWDDVLKVAGRLYKAIGLTARENLALATLMGEAHFQLENWKQAIEPLFYTFQNGTSDDRIYSATSLTVCLVRLQEFKKLYEFVPFVYKTPARYDLGLQMALIEEGDICYDDARSNDALLLFRLVYTKAELIEQLNERVAKLKLDKQRMLFSEKSQVGMAKASTARRIDRAVKRYGEQLEELKDFPEYDQELTIRMGNCYFELNRYLEALYTYRSIFEDHPEHPLAQQALYSCFTTAFAMQDIERAIKEGYDYIEAYPPPESEFWDTLTLNLATIHVEREEFQKAIDIAEKAIKLKPDHAVIDNMLYIIGYSNFQLSRIIKAMETFEIIFENHPRTQFLQPAQYWHAMGHLFQAFYTPAREEFTVFVDTYSIGALYEDAYYRLGVSYYGEGDFTNANVAFTAFVEEFPESILRSEAHAMSGDIYGSWGQLDEAIEQYRFGIDTAVNMVQTDYAYMQTSRTLELEQHYPEIVKLWQDYLVEHPEEGNYTEAVYWMGAAYKNMDELENCLNTFYDGVVKYGDKPENHGIDMIIRDLIVEFENMPDLSDPTVKTDEIDQESFQLLLNMKQRLREEMSNAQREKKITLLLRLNSLFYAITKDQGLLDAFMRERIIPYAGPISLVMMGREAVRRKDLDFAQQIYAHFLEEHNSSDLALEALKGQAEAKISSELYNEAVPLLQDIGTRFAMLEDAAWANLRLADIHMRKKDYEAAYELYSLVASVKDWRGEYTPEALYGMGQAKLGLRQTEEAFAYFQNIYILYSGYPTWAGRGYIASAKCLRTLRKPDEAIATLREMLDTEKLAALPEGKEARQLLSEYQ